ncbi:MAG: hypothetical protein U0V64_16115 [Cyclobacteriaceae bacterium]
MAKFESFAGKLLRLRGGYVNHPLDEVARPSMESFLLYGKNMATTKMAMVILMQKTSRS